MNVVFLKFDFSKNYSKNLKIISNAYYRLSALVTSVYHCDNFEEFLYIAQKWKNV